MSTTIRQGSNTSYVQPLCSQKFHVFSPDLSLLQPFDAAVALEEMPSYGYANTLSDRTKVSATLT